MKLKKNKGVLISCIFLLILLIAALVFLIVKIKAVKINDNIQVIKEEYKLDKKKNEIDMNIDIKNTSRSDEKIDNVSVSVKNVEGKTVFFYYENIGETLHAGETYNLDVNGSIENSGLDSEKDIKEIKYELNS